MRISPRLASGVGWIAAALIGALPADAQVNPDRLTMREVPSSPPSDGFTLAAVGDLIYLRPMLATIEHRSPEMLRILRDADVAFGNLETNIIDLDRFTGAPQAQSGGTWMFASPGVVADLRAMGFDIVTLANNHITDFGVEGMMETRRRLDEAGIAHAGTGRSLSASRMPAYVDLAGGRVALVALTTSFTAMTPAGDAAGQLPARPGANVIRAQRVELVSQEDLTRIAAIAGASPDTKQVDMEGLRFRLRSPDDKNAFSFDVRADDVAANLLSVRQARQNGNLVVTTFHTHLPDNKSSETPAFLEDFARAAIDAGADTVIGHGPHQLRGIEIYKGRPIFYSLGNFAMMNNSLDSAPADMFARFGVDPSKTSVPELLQARNARDFADPSFLESVIAVTRFVGGKAAEIRLYPIELGTDAKGADRGVPRTAKPAVGRALLERLQHLSAAYGTRITIENGIGLWRAGK